MSTVRIGFHAQEIHNNTQGTQQPSQFREIREIREILITRNSQNQFREIQL